MIEVLSFLFNLFNAYTDHLYLPDVVDNFTPNSLKVKNELHQLVL